MKNLKHWFHRWSIYLIKDLRTDTDFNIICKKTFIKPSYSIFSIKMNIEKTKQIVAVEVKDIDKTNKIIYVNIK
jgi:hypothetical protein